MLRGLAVTLLVAALQCASAAQPERGVNYQSPALNYLQHCAGCHRLDGAGSARNDVPDMRGVVGHFTRAAGGREFLIQVAGVAQAPLPPPDLAALMNWLLPQFSKAEMAPDFVPYTAAEVAALVATRPADLTAVRADLVEQLRAMGHDIDAY